MYRQDIMAWLSNIGQLLQIEYMNLEGIQFQNSYMV